MVIIAIDPGCSKRGGGCAMARFHDGTLRGVAFEHTMHVDDLPPLDGPGVIVLERPHIRPDTPNAQTIVDLAMAGALFAGRVAGALRCEVETVTPVKWKGAVPKPVHHHRLWDGLSKSERALIGGDVTAFVIERACTAGGRDRWSRPGVAYYPRGWETHNLLDAVALGCWRIGRMR